MVPAFLFAAVVMAASCIFGLVVVGCLSPEHGSWSKLLLVVATAVSGVLCAALLVAAASLEQKHWDDTCHRMGGSLTDGGDCWTGHEVHVP